MVGAGNSGAEIGLELSRTHRVLLSGPSTGQIPVRHGTLPARLGFRVFRFFGHRVLRVDTWIGRKLGPKLLASGDPLIRTKLKDLLAAGVERVPRVVGMRDGVPVLEDDRVARGGERRLVHGLPHGLRLDRSPGVRRRRAAEALPRSRRIRAGVVLPRA